MKSNRLVPVFVALGLLGGVAFGYWQLVSSGADITRAAQSYLSALSEEQRARSNLSYDIPERVDWDFRPRATREGLQVKEMSPAQRGAAHALLRAALSEIGYDKAVKIMDLENMLRELEKNKKGGPIRDPERYYFTIYGKPEQSGRWGLGVEGHHFSLNAVIEKGKVISSTPTAFASNPATVITEVAGAAKPGTRILAKEEQLAFDLVAALDAEQKKIAIIDAKAPAEVRGVSDPQPPQSAPVGIAAKALKPAQQQILMSLVSTYTNNLPNDVAREELDAIMKNGLENLYFAWAGPEKPGIGHYYRIQAPSCLIEFVNTQPDAAGNPANHIHCVWREPTGDFAIPIGAAK